LKPRAATRFDTIRGLVHTYVTSFERIGLPSTLNGWEDIPELSASVDRIVACEIAGPSSALTQDQMMLQIHVYQPLESDSFEEFSAGSRSDEDDVMAATVSELPNRSWNGLWDSLIYDNDIKMKLLDYIHATLVFSDANVDCEHDFLLYSVT
jgi:pachytene checkpoint protein 2